jgi:hypothetical protein
MTKPGYVYFLHAVGSEDSRGFERYKIGLTTRDVEDRLKELNSGQSPYWLVEKWSIRVSDCETVESLLHEHFQTRRLYFNVENGTTGYSNEISPHQRKSTEWFMFSVDELDAVEVSYTNAEKQYPWRMTAPILRQRDIQKKTRRQERVYHQAVDRFADSQSRSGGGWGIAATLLAAIIAIPSVQSAGNFADAVNTPSPTIAANNQAKPKPPSTPKHSQDWMRDAMTWLASPFNRPATITIKELANIRQSNPGGYPTKTGKVAYPGTILKGVKDGEWWRIQGGEYDDRLVHSTMVK